MTAVTDRHSKSNGRRAEPEKLGGDTTMDTPLTMTVEPKHLKDGWVLVLEFLQKTGDLVTASIMPFEQGRAMPDDTLLSFYVVKHLGNVLAREAAGCFAPNKKQAVLTFNTAGRVKNIA